MSEVHFRITGLPFREAHSTVTERLVLFTKRNRNIDSDTVNISEKGHFSGMSRIEKDTQLERPDQRKESSPLKKQNGRESRKCLRG